MQRVKKRVKKGEGDKGSYLRLDTPKTPSSLREVTIHPDLLAQLSKMAKTDGELYITTGTRQFMNPATYEYQYHRILKKACVTDVNYHTLRHSFTTACVVSGMDIKTLSELLGHAKVATILDIYTHPSISMKQKEIQKFPTYVHLQRNLPCGCAFFHYK